MFTCQLFTYQIKPKADFPLGELFARIFWIMQSRFTMKNSRFSWIIRQMESRF